MTRVVAVSVGACIALTVPVIAGLFLGETLLSFYCVVVVQGLGAFLLSFSWPNLSWRVGLWMFSVWILILLFAVILGGPPTKMVDLYDAATYLWILFSGCVGGWLGAIIGRRLRKKSKIKSSPA